MKQKIYLVIAADRKKFMKAAKEGMKIENMNCIIPTGVVYAETRKEIALNDARKHNTEKDQEKKHTIFYVEETHLFD